MFLSLLLAALPADLQRGRADAAKPPLHEVREWEPLRPPWTIHDAPPAPQDRPRRPPKQEKAKVGREGKPGEAVALREEMRSTRSPERTEEILDLLEKTKGGEYTDALAALIPGLRRRPEVKQMAQQALIRRMCRLTAKTLLLHLDTMNVECRRAAAIAAGVKKEKSLVPRLIDHLADEVTVVIEAAHQSLKQITGQDFGKDVAKWEQWWDKQAK